MAMESIITIVPIGSVVGASIVTGIIVWISTALALNRRWKKIFWPHADNIAKQKITEQKHEIQKLTDELAQQHSERIKLSRQVEAIKKTLEVL
jgi:septal ring factor EnvC (AmiA/AmiB activator)